MIFKAVSTLKGINEIKDFSKRHNICYKTAQILMQRGIDTDEKFNKFINPSIDDLKDSFLLNGMTEAVERIKVAIQNNESILLFGDYDVDGISAVTILHTFLKDKISNLNYFLPNRYEDGYGLTIESSKKVIEKFKPNLIITVDCGISCYKEVEYIKSCGVDIIITDHHEIPEIIPNTIVIDPKIENQQYGFNGLCGAGVALKLVQAFVGKENLQPYLPICAIATVSDIVPLIDENRAIVKLGLELQDYLPKGIKMLLSDLKIKSINSSAISFKIAPRLNAAGRLGNAYVALELCIETNKKQLQIALETLDKQNTERQRLSQQIYDECVAEINKLNHNSQKAIILKNKCWDSGLLGIACARLVDDYFKPVFLFSEVGDELKGSVRSIDAINIHTVLSCCGDTLETFGGHSMAAGLSLKAENLESFKQKIYDYLNKNTQDKHFLPVKKYDVALKEEDITLNFVKELQLLQPFGCDNPNPIFMLTYNNCYVKKMNNFDNHLNIDINNQIKFIAFNALKNKDDYMYAEQKQSIFELQINEFRNKEYLKGIIKHTLFFGYNKNLQEISTGYQIKQLLNKSESNKFINFFEFDQLQNLLNNLLTSYNGTAIILYNYDKYLSIKNILKNYKLNYYVGGSQSKSIENCVIFGLSNIEDVKNYNNVVFCDELLNRSFVSTFNNTIYAIKNDKFSLPKLNFERSYFGQVYIGLKSMIKHDNVYLDDLILFERFKKENPQLKTIKFYQFVFCLYTFVELNIIKIDKENNKLIYNDNKKTNLENSNFYNQLRFISKLK